MVYDLPVTSGQVITTSTNYRYAYFDSLGEVIQTHNPTEHWNPRTVTIPEGVATYRIVSRYTLHEGHSIDNFQIEYGENLTEYEPYYIRIENLENPLDAYLTTENEPWEVE